MKKIIFDPFWKINIYIFFFKKKNKILKLWARKKLIKKYDIHVGLNSTLGENLKFPHPSSIVIGEGVKIGDNCTIYQGVTLGMGDGYPKLEDSVIVYPNTTIINSITVKRNTIIGANSLVIKDTKENSVYVGNPATYLRGLKNGK